MPGGLFDSPFEGILGLQRVLLQIAIHSSLSIYMPSGGPQQCWHDTLEPRAHTSTSYFNICCMNAACCTCNQNHSSSQDACRRSDLLYIHAVTQSVSLSNCRAYLIQHRAVGQKDVTSSFKLCVDVCAVMCIRVLCRSRPGCRWGFHQHRSRVSGSTAAAILRQDSPEWGGTCAVLEAAAHSSSSGSSGECNLSSTFGLQCLVVISMTDTAAMCGSRLFDETHRR